MLRSYSRSVDDVLGLIVLSAVTAATKAGSIPASELMFILTKGAVFIAAAGFSIPMLLRRHGERIDRLCHRNALFSIAIASCIGFAFLAEYFGLAAIVGAFLAGAGFANIPDQEELKSSVDSIGDLLVPVFFVSVGMQVDIATFLSPEIILLGLGISLIAVVGKLVGCGLGAVGMKARSALIVGVGMVPRGEVGLIVASIGKGLGVIPDSLVAVITLVSILTTVIVPPVLPVLFRKPQPSLKAEAA